MTKKTFTTRQVDTAALVKYVLLGAGIALVLMLVFLFPVDGRPEWGQLWKARPLIVISLAGAAGGACAYWLQYLSYQGGWKRIMASIAGVLIYIIGLWLGTVLGLNGTLWH